MSELILSHVNAGRRREKKKLTWFPETLTILLNTSTALTKYLKCQHGDIQKAPPETVKYF